MTPQDAATQLVQATAAHLNTSTSNIQKIEVQPRRISAFVYQLDADGNKFIQDGVVAYDVRSIAYRYAQGSIPIQEFET